jgi:hypothetical protein
MCRLRWTRLQAARDMYYTVTLLNAEQNLQSGRNLFKELFTVPRNRRATQAASLVMFMQRGSLCRPVRGDLRADVRV